MLVMINGEKVHWSLMLLEFEYLINAKIMSVQQCNSFVQVS